MPSAILRQAAFLKDPEAPFGYIALAFPSAKDPTHAGSGKSTAVAIAGDVPYDWFEQWGPS